MPGIKGQHSGGRCRKPRLLHLAEGTLRKGRHAGVDIEAPAGTPPVPVGLAGEALRVWGVLTELLRQQGTLSTVDGQALENHCKLAALVARLEAEVAALPTLTFERVSIDGSGQEHREPRAHPLVSQLRAGRTAIRASLQEFGATPSSRTRVTKPVTPIVDVLAKYKTR